MRKNVTTIIVVELRNKDDKTSILKNTKYLKYSKKFNKVFINRDLTFAEMLIEKRDRFNSKNASSEFYYEIEDGRIVKIFQEWELKTKIFFEEPKV